MATPVAHGPDEVIVLLVSWVVQTTLLFVVVILDERRLSEEQLERAWPPATRDMALVVLGALALPFHFARTRGRGTDPIGVLLRFAWFLIGIVVVVVVSLFGGLVVWGICIALSYALDMPALRK